MSKFNFTPFDLIVSVTLVLSVSLIINKLLAWLYDAPVNIESVYLTSLILVLIITPKIDYQTISFLVFASVVSTASKFVLAIEKKHIFNPAAIAVVISGLALNWYPTWWIANSFMMPFIIIGGLLLLRRINRWDLFLTFFITTLTVSMYFIVANHRDAYTYLTNLILHSSLLFLGFVMLTEPATLPPTRNLQMVYAILVGILFVPDIKLGSIFTTPELALVIGNVFSYTISPKYKLFLRLIKKKKLSSDIYNFTFELNKPMKFKPGQYMEWTLVHKDSDRRGVRRYLTIASAPTEGNLQLGVKFYPNGSTYKRALLDMEL
ncbi:MAG TPA: RnfABCDGE type electron transport complex subunit D, partial [Candidatus Dojkabacteria bacterium]|nr:RnfABCDGE type electron transport complex subunit D [Candidatus Dojkabacteria bacterium]